MELVNTLMLVAAPSHKCKLKLNEEGLAMETVMAASSKIKCDLIDGMRNLHAVNGDGLQDLWKVKPST
jgi:hypothetical protein